MDGGQFLAGAVTGVGIYMIGVWVMPWLIANVFGGQSPLPGVISGTPSMPSFQWPW